MKAKEYFEKYEAGIHSNEAAVVNKSCYNMLIELGNECKSTLDSRHAYSDKALVGTLKEFNDKWNAIIALDVKKYGSSIIRYNGFKMFWMQEIYGLNTIWK